MITDLNEIYKKKISGKKIKSTLAGFNPLVNLLIPPICGKIFNYAANHNIIRAGFMKRILRISLLLMFINVQLSNAVILNDKGITTEKGFISWDQVIEMQNRLNSMKETKKEKQSQESSILVTATPIIGISALIFHILTRIPS